PQAVTASAASVVARTVWMRAGLVIDPPIVSERVLRKPADALARSHWAARLSDREAGATVDPDAHGRAGVGSRERGDGVEPPAIQFELQPDSVLERYRPGDTGIQRAGRVEGDVRRPRQQQLSAVLEAPVEAEETRNRDARRLLEQLPGRTGRDELAVDHD